MCCVLPGGIGRIAESSSGRITRTGRLQLDKADTMRTHLCRLAISAKAVALLALFSPHTFGAEAAAQSYPNRPVRMIVPFAPGGGSDIVGRVMAQALTEHWGHAVVVDNRPGAGSTVGAALAAKAPPDGHTVMVSSSAIVFSPALYRGLSFDIQQDFRPVTLIGRQPSMLVVARSVSAASVKQLVDIARAQPGKLTFGSAGVGSATHLGGALLNVTAGIDLLHVPYKSAGLAMTALLAGEVQVLVTNMATVLPHVKAGRVRGLGVSSQTRTPLAPEIPTVIEGGLPGYEYDTWYAMLVPAATPERIVRDLHQAAERVMKQPKVSQQLTSQGIAAVMSAPDELKAYLASELSKWSKIIRASVAKD
jgi:tripartite-type tricarboxylate transporter receptor subunit TctC